MAEAVMPKRKKEKKDRHKQPKKKPLSHLLAEDQDKPLGNHLKPGQSTSAKEEVKNKSIFVAENKPKDEPHESKTTVGSCCPQEVNLNLPASADDTAQVAGLGEKKHIKEECKELSDNAVTESAVAEGSVSSKQDRDVKAHDENTAEEGKAVFDQPPAVSDQTGYDEDQVVQESLMGPAAAEISVPEARTAESESQAPADIVAKNEVTISEVTRTDVTASEVITTDVTASEVTTTDVTAAEVTTTEVTASEGTTTEVTASEVTTTKVTASEVTTTEVTTPEVTTSKVATSDVTESEDTAPEGQLVHDGASCELANSKQNSKVPKARYKRLYPELDVSAKEEGLLPFTKEQLMSLYYNPELAQNKSFVDKFLTEVKKDNHEFYEIVLNYYRAKNHLTSSEHDIQVLLKDYEQYADLVWETKQEKVTLQGQCEDKAKVSIEHLFPRAVFNEPSRQEVLRTLRDISGHIHDEYSLYAYEAQLSRLQVESYIYQLYKQNPALHEIPQNEPARAWLSHQRDVSVSRQVELLKTCISILFMFQRRPAKNDDFINDTRQWLSQMVATLLRLATIEDHLYLLNQVLRCPAGVGQWAGNYIQLVLPPSQSIGDWRHHLVDHFVASFAFMMMPIKAREELLHQLRVTLTPTGDKGNENPWILVDSDGEEDEDPVNSWLYLHENDLVAFLRQFPIDDVVKHVLHIRTEDDQINYDIRMTNENGLMKFFAFVTCLIKILKHGLKTFSLTRYRQLNKRLGKLVRYLIRCTSDQWENFKVAYPNLSEDVMQRLQVEYDQVFLRSVTCILSAQKLGSWQFLADIPYRCGSVQMMWRLLWLMYQGCQGVANIQLDISPQQCISNLQDPDSKLVFEEKLIIMPTSEATYLLTTFANMASSRPPSDQDFVEVVTRMIYEIAYIREHTREFCSRTGRELLASIALKHPFIISLLLKSVDDTIDKIGKVSLYLFKELPLQVWRPTEEDIQAVRRWLVNEALSTPINQLARLVVEKMNWGYNEQADDLFLGLSLHRRVAVMVIEAYQAQLSGKIIGGLFTESIKQMFKSQQSDDQLLANWAWQILLRLRLHAAMQPRPSLCSPTSGYMWEEGGVNIHTDASFHPIVLAMQANFAISSYAALMVSKAGHSVPEFCSEGLPLLETIVAKFHYVPTIRALAYTLPMFFSTPERLTSKEEFYGIFQMLLQADQSKKSMFSSEFPGAVTKLLSSMIESQIQVGSIPGGVGGETVITFWLHILTKIPKWYQDRNIIFLLDNILQAAFQVQATWQAACSFFSDLFMEFLKAEKDHNVISSLVSWLAHSQSSLSFIEASSCPECSYLAYAVLDAENEHEDVKLWPELQMNLISSPSLTVDQSLKKVGLEHKMEDLPSIQRLSIYRWAQQAMDMDPGHPLLPLVWQRFFILYLGRLTVQSTLPHRGSVGERFFDSAANITMLKRMKTKLRETADYFHKRVTDLDRRLGEERETEAEDTVTEQSTASESLLVDHDSQMAAREFYEKLIKFYQTLSFWVEEPRLHDPSLYLPALPPEYEANKLLTLFQKQKTPWLEFVDTDKISQNLRKLSNEWNTHVIHAYDNYVGTITFQSQDEIRTATERLLNRLKSTDSALPPPRHVLPPPPVPEFDSNLLLDKNNLLYSLKGDFTALVDYARVFARRVARHTELDQAFADLLPDLYTNEMTETVLRIPCKSMFNPTHQCKGPAAVNVRCEEKKRNDIINRKIDENRSEFRQLLKASLDPPPPYMCCAAVHVENAITCLIRLASDASNKDQTKRVAAMEVGTSLFYITVTFITNETNRFPPSKQFFAFCIEILGKEFIMNNPSQTQALLRAMLDAPALIGHLAPNFTPNVSPEQFVSMYDKVVRVPEDRMPDIMFALLTKFHVQQWLDQGQSLSQRSALIEVVGQALCMCGQGPQPSLRLAFGIYRSHLVQLCVYQFPDHYGDVLKLILKGSAGGQLHPDVWDDFLNLLDCKTETADEIDSSPTGEQSVTHARRQSTIQHELSHTHVKETMEWLSNYFYHQRGISTEAAGFGLYPKWKPYVKSLSVFLGFLTHKYITHTAAEARAEEKDPQQAVSELWTLIKDLFAPWIEPYNNNGVILSPWIQADAAVASILLSTWAEAVECLHLAFEDLLPPSYKNAFDFLLTYYVTTLAQQGTPDHVVYAFSNRLVTLPWNKFYPDLHAMQLILQVQEGHGDRCFELVGNIFASIPWLLVAEFYTTYQSGASATVFHVCLFTLLVRLSKESYILENTQLPVLLSAAEKLDWNYLDAKSYNDVIVWYIEHCDPRCILAERTANSAMTLGLLKAASGFCAGAKPVVHPESPVKRASFVRCVVQLLAKCSHLKDVNVDSFHVILTNLVTEVEAVIGTLMEPSSAEQESICLCQEVLSVLNNCNPQGKSGSVLLSTLLQWIESSPHSLLLMSLLKAACRCLASVTHMVLLVEAAFEAYFTTDVQQNDMAGWGQLLAVLQVPELSHQQFLDAGIEQQCYLTLFACLLQKQPFVQDIKDDLDHLTQLLVWHAKAKPSAANEAKLMLFWFKVLELILRQLDFAQYKVAAVQRVQDFLTTLHTLSEDKASAGLLGAIGLGRKSLLSQRFRLVAKCLTAYLLAQIPNNSPIRLHADAPGYVKDPRQPSSPRPSGTPLPSQQAHSALIQLDTLKTNKQYSCYCEQIEYAIKFTCNPAHSLREARVLLTDLASTLFPEKNYLALLRLATV